MTSVLITGGTGYTGRRLLQRLVATGQHVRVLVRGTSDVALLPPQVEIVRGDLEDVSSLGSALVGVRSIFHLAHVRFSANLLQAVSLDAKSHDAVEQIIVVSSLRALSRIRSVTVDEVLAAEATVAAAGVPWTILRPSMIFGEGDDRNISRLVERIRRGAWIPGIGGGCLHQPVFVDDVVAAILASAVLPVARGRIYAIAGARALTWDELVTTVGDILGKSPRVLPMPAGAVARLLALIETTGLSLPIRAEQVQRMLDDKAYDITPAREDLGYRPHTFRAALGRIHAPLGS